MLILKIILKTIHFMKKTNGYLRNILEYIEKSLGVIFILFNNVKSQSLWEARKLHSGEIRNMTQTLQWARLQAFTQIREKARLHHIRIYTTLSEV